MVEWMFSFDRRVYWRHSGHRSRSRDHWSPESIVQHDWDQSVAEVSKTVWSDRLGPSSGSTVTLCAVCKYPTSCHSRYRGTQCSRSLPGFTWWPSSTTTTHRHLAWLSASTCPIQISWWLDSDSRRSPYGALVSVTRFTTSREFITLMFKEMGATSSFSMVFAKNLSFWCWMEVSIFSLPLILKF